MTPLQLTVEGCQALCKAEMVIEQAHLTRIDYSALLLFIVVPSSYMPTGLSIGANIMHLHISPAKTIVSYYLAITELIQKPI